MEAIVRKKLPYSTVQMRYNIYLLSQDLGASTKEHGKAGNQHIRNCQRNEEVVVDMTQFAITRNTNYYKEVTKNCSNDYCNKDNSLYNS